MSRDIGEREEVFMPRGDGTGPKGTGPRTGRGAGYCAGNARARHDNLARPLVDRKTEIEILRRQVANLENALKNINEQLTQLSEEK